MTEPAGTVVGGLALYKLGAFGLLALLAAIVVMAMTMPKTPLQAFVAIVSTLVGSLCGGAFVVRWFELAHWANDDVGMIALGGIIFACGLPAWVVVRAWFVYAEKRRDAMLPDLLKEIREAAGK
ncbi:hypothetical protein D9M68_251700 [compost metagenome]